MAFQQPREAGNTIMSKQVEQTRDQFVREGYAVIRDFVTRGEVEEIHREVGRYIAQVIPTLPPGEAFYEIKDDPDTLKQLPHINAHDPYFRRWHCDRRLEDLAALLLGGPVIPSDLQWFNKPPRVGKGTPAHQDGFYDKIEPKEMVNMWLALDPVDEENGCVRYVSGSHKRGLREHRRSQTLGFSQALVGYGPEDEAAEVAVCAEPGDLLVHHGLTIHRADANGSDRSRRAMGSVYYAAHVRIDEEGTTAYSRDLTADLLRDGKL